MWSKAAVKLNYFVLFILFFATSVRGMDEKKTPSTSRYSNQHFIRDIALAGAISYCGMFLNTFFHEMGHACTAKFLFNAPINVYMGSFDLNNIKFSTSGIHWVGLNPQSGFNVINLQNISTSKKVAMLLAGPLAGLSVAVGQHLLLKKQTILPSLTTKLCIWLNTINFTRNIGTLTPTYKSTDGGQIGQALDILNYDENGVVTQPLIREVGCIITSALGSNTFFVLASLAYAKKASFKTFLHGMKEFLIDDWTD